MRLAHGEGLHPVLSFKGKLPRLALATASSSPHAEHPFKICLIFYFLKEYCFLSFLEEYSQIQF